MVMKYILVCLVALSLLGSFCDGQWGEIYRPSPRMYPRPRTSPPFQKVQVPQGTQQQQQQQQQQQIIMTPLKWTYPARPTAESIPVGPNVPKLPVSAQSVSVQCRETDAYVEVKEDLFATGQIISPSDLTMGPCSVSAQDNFAHVFIFQPQLQDCGSVLSMTADTFIYTFTLYYNPQPHGSAPVVRTSSAAIIVECRYPRMQNVSSLSLDPYWKPFSTVKLAEEFLYFNMTLMTADWQYLRPDGNYFLGDMINVQVSVEQYFHIPLRVYVDSCIATVTPDTGSSPSYVFIDNGCMVDGFLTGSGSQFMQRSVDNKLQFQLEAFMFPGAKSGTLYITCHVIATAAANQIDAQHRACSFIHSAWKEVNGADAACATCDTVVQGASKPAVGQPGPSTSSSGAGSGGPASPFPNPQLYQSVAGDHTGSLAPAASPYETTLPGSSSGTGQGKATRYPGTGYGPLAAAPYYQGITPFSPLSRQSRDVSNKGFFEFEADLCMGPLKIENKVRG